MKRIFSLILLLIIVLGSATQNSVHAEDDDPCKNPNPNDKGACTIIRIAELAKDVTDYYSSFNIYLDVGKSLLQALHWMKTSDPNEELFKRLHDELTALAEGIDWTETMNFIAPYHANAARAIDGLAANKTNALNDRNYPTWSEEGPTVFADYPYTEGPFHRPYNSKTALSTANFFNYTMKDLDPRPGNKVYDWRLGIPPFLQMISWRIQYIAAMYPNFRTTGERDFELKSYSEALQFHYNRMLSGVRCGRYRPNTGSNAVNPINENYWACGDIYSGLAIYAHYVLPSDRLAPREFDYPDPKDGVWGCTEAEYRFLDCLEPDKNIYLDRDKYIWVASATVNKDGTVTNDDEILAELKSLVMRRMPLFEMKAMIDTLTLYTHRSLDLTEKYHRIPAYGAPKLCLDTGYGNVVMLGQCNGGNGQQWVYNRIVLLPDGRPDTVMSDTIFSPVSGLCLDIADRLFMNGAFQIKAWKSAVPGMVAELSHCTGHDSQKWTYNRVTHVLQNKLGTVLDIQWNNLQAGTLVWSWPLNGGRAQQWQAD